MRMDCGDELAGKEMRKGYDKKKGKEMRRKGKKRRRVMEMRRKKIRRHYGDEEGLRR